MTGDSRTSADEVDPESSTETESDGHVRALLSDLPRPSMPPAVWDRLSAVIAAEAEARSQDSTVSSTVVTLGRRSRGSSRRILVAVGGVAAAGLVGMAILVSGSGREQVNRLPGTASVVSVSTSGTKYYRQQLATQVSHRWHKTRATNTPSSGPTTDGGATATGQVPLDPANTTPPDSAPAPDLLATTFAGTHDGLVTCLDRVSPGAEPVLLDIGTYHSDDLDPGVPAAVLAYQTGDGGALDVFVIDEKCSIGAGHPLARVTTGVIEP